MFIENYPPGYCYHLIALNRYYDTHAPTLLIAFNDDNEHEQALREEIFGKYIPHKTVIWRREGDSLLSSALPFSREQTPIEGKTALYLCYEGACQNPVTDLEEMRKVIQGL